MAIISTPGLTLVKLDDNTGTLIVQGSTGNTNNLMEFRTPGDRRPQPYTSGDYSMFNGYPSSVKTYIDKDGTLSVNDDNSYSYPSGTVFKTTKHAIDTFGPEFYFRTSYTNATWKFQNAGNPEFLAFNQSGIYSHGETPWVPQATTKKAFVVKGLASQTANLQEWQSSAGTIYGAMNAYGSMYISNQMQSASASIGNTGFAGASAVVLKIIGVSSQTANLTEWQNSSGAVLAYVNSEGSIYAGNRVVAPGDAELRGNTFFGSPSFNVGTLNITTRAVDRTGATIRAVASQTADLQQWQDSSGTTLVKVGSNGGLTIGASSGNLLNFYSVGGGYGLGAVDANGNFGINGLRVGFPYPSAGVATVYTAGPANIGLVVRGYASQTANLQEWQNSAGTALAKVDASGMLIVGNTTGTIQVKSSGSTGSYPTSGAGIELIAGAFSGSDSIQAYNRDTSTWRYLAFYSAGNQFLSTYASSIPVVITGAASQSANLTEWRNSSAGVIAKIDNAGVGSLFGLYTGSASFGGVSWNGISNPASVTTLPTLVIKGISSQTADLQQWQDSAGTVYAFINNFGQLSIGQNPTIYSNARISLNTVAASVVGMVIRGVASQSANLQEWQNSAGTTLLSVGSPSDSTNITFSASQNGKIMWGGNTVWGIGTITGQTNVMYPYSNDRVALIVKGLASQTANLQEWQNSAGSVIANISSVGGLFAQRIDTGNFANSGDIVNSFGIYTGFGAASSYIGAAVSIGTWATTTVNLILRQKASQTANMQEWQNSSGTVLASMSASGAFSAVTKSFVIKHPIKEGKLLRYGSLEGPENGVYVRGKIDGGNVIDLPDYWIALVDESTITVNITPIGSSQNLYIEEIKDNKIYVAGGMDAKFFYTVFAERKDVAKLVVEE